MPGSNRSLCDSLRDEIQADVRKQRKDEVVLRCYQKLWLAVWYIFRSGMWRPTSAWTTWPERRTRKWAFSTATAWEATRYHQSEEGRKTDTRTSADIFNP